jgi:hypothetical protein
MFRVSRGFIAALGGVAITLLAWFGSWAWPGWPASFALDLLGRIRDFAELPRLVKGSVVVLLIVINVGTWAMLIRALLVLMPKACPRAMPRVNTRVSPR